ncbi:MAG: hypothetical protein PHR16_04335 [Methylovulum sp.]|nr:hypothetical protein [Methylovulum sp.]
MADLMRYVSKSLSPNAKVDLYFGKWAKIGDGDVLGLEPLHINMKGKGQVLGFDFDSSVEITMPDFEPKGICTIKVGNNAPVSTKYWDENGKLRMNAYNLYVYPDGNWTWVWVETEAKGIPIKVWIGIWPQGYTMLAADMTTSTELSPNNRP